MRRLIAGLILIALNSIVVMAQQTDQQSLDTKTPAPTGLLASEKHAVTFPLLASPFNFGQSQKNNLTIFPLGQSTKQHSPFVVLDGAVYISVLGIGSLIPMSGGGASGCFSRDLPQRITNLTEFLPKLDAIEQPKPKL
ncbi:MAG: hypothetical protein AABN95_04110 [Acidobacteriota bacterium]